MQRAFDREQLWPVIRGWKHRGQNVALVPTMGNLHQGHLELVRVARQAADRVVASIYVNPTQFGPSEDFSRYPRTLERDCEQLKAAGCDLVFVPDNATMYPFGDHAAIGMQAPADLATVLEGASRPGHFDGVVTVVARLFNLVTPDRAVFGEKDYQQLLIIRRLVEDMGYPIQIMPVPTVREAGGLALSSRNQYLGADQRIAALALNRALQAAAGEFKRGSPRERAEQQAVEALAAEGFSVDYVAIRRSADLSIPGSEDSDLRVLGAARIGDTRLIDNFSVS